MFFDLANRRVIRILRSFPSSSLGTQSWKLQLPVPHGFREAGDSVNRVPKLELGNPRSNGFTLVEMTVVLLLITLLASVAVRETAELGFQTRYEQTKERLEMIRQAILGNPKLVINGQQAVSGFVADMGRLPDNLRELIHINGYCFGARGWNNKVDCEDVGKGNSTWKTLCTDNNYTDQNSCETNNATWLGRKTFGYCFDNVNTLLAIDDETTCLATVGNVWKPMFYGGWNGPYINISGNPDDADALTDGWGNQATLATDQSYGWSFFQLNALTGNNLEDSGNLIIQSFGKNQQRDNAIPANTDYENDFPPNINLFGADYFPNPAVLRQNWLLDISQSISVNFLKKFGSDKYCGFSGPGTNYTSEQSCKNAGGSWSGSSCTFDVSSCKSVGGKWKSCFLTPAFCANAGGVSSLQCQFTEKSCNAAGSTWNTTTKQCPLSSSIVTKADCALNGGAWVQNCVFDNAACSATPTGGTHSVGTWESTAPASCSFTTQSECYNIGGRSSNIISGQSTGDECYMSHAEFSGNQYSPESCQTASGNWKGRICMNVFYRRNGAVVYSSSLPTNISEDGSYQTVQFSFPNYNNQTDCENNNGTWDGTLNQCFYNVPIGQDAIGIYEYDGDCDPVNNPLYPADKQNPIQVDFHPHTALPVINW